MSKSKREFYVGWFNTRKGDTRSVMSPSRDKGLAKAISVNKYGETKFKMVRTGEVFWLDRSGMFLERSR